MIETTGSRRDAASPPFNLPDFRVIDAVDDGAGGRRVLVESLAPPGCPSCGVVATRVHARREQVVRDVLVAGPVPGAVGQAALGLRRGSVRSAHVLGAFAAGPAPGTFDGPAQGRAGHRGDRVGPFRARDGGRALGVVVASAGRTQRRRGAAARCR